MEILKKFQLGYVPYPCLKSHLVFPSSFILRKYDRKNLRVGGGAFNTPLNDCSGLRSLNIAKHNHKIHETSQEEFGNLRINEIKNETFKLFPLLTKPKNKREGL